MIVKEKQCRVCKKIKSLDNFHKHIHKKDGYRNKCKECRIIESRQRYLDNKEYIDEQNVKWAKDNIEKRRIIANRWNKNNRDCVMYHDAKRRASKKQAFPKWLSELQQNQIKTIYKKCSEYRSMGFDFHVDHIVPLQGKNVSGLHVPWNLRITTAKFNLSKGSK